MFTNEKGFTLVEMLVVLLIISVLIILFIPTLSNRGSEVHEKGCEALKQVVQAQVDLYTVEKGFEPDSFDVLIDDYITDEHLSCVNGKELILEDGEVRIE